MLNVPITTNYNLSPLSRDLRIMGSKTNTETERFRAWAHLHSCTFEDIAKKIGYSVDGLDKQEKESYAQHALIVALDKAHQYTGETDDQAKAWLRTIAVNKAKNDISRSKTYALEFLEDIAPTECDLLLEVEEKLLLHDIEKFLSALGQREQDIIKMLSEEQMNQKEIAEELKLTPARINQIISQICEKARIYLGYEKSKRKGYKK